MADRMRKCIACERIQASGALFCDCGGVVVTVSQLTAMKVAHVAAVDQQKAARGRRLALAYGLAALKWVAVGACIGLGFRLLQFAAW